MSLEEELQKMYDAEINIEISWLFDGGINLKLGDELNGYVKAGYCNKVAEIVPWFQAAIAECFPDSDYCRNNRVLVLWGRHCFRVRMPGSCHAFRIPDSSGDP